MSKIKATLFSINEGFKIEREMIFEEKHLPVNLFSKEKSYSNSNPTLDKRSNKISCDHPHECSLNFSYYWITSEFFKDSVVVDCQAKNGIFEKGHPDFIVYNRKNVKEKKYVEFKSSSDSLGLSQIKWISNNPYKSKHLLMIQKINTNHELEKFEGL